MTIITSAGTTLSLSAAQPATYNQAGYEALSFTLAGKVTDLGDIPSRIYQLVTQQLIASRGMEKGKGGYDLGSQTIVISIDPDDAGQAMIDAATISDSPYSVKIDHPLIGTIYAQALVMGGPKSYGDVNSPVTRSITLEYTIVDDTTDGVVTVAAA